MEPLWLFHGSLLGDELERAMFLPEERARTHATLDSSGQAVSDVAHSLVGSHLARDGFANTSFLRV